MLDLKSGGHGLVLNHVVAEAFYFIACCVSTPRTHKYLMYI